MRLRTTKKAKRKEWHKSRERQRMKTFEVKLNFVAGLLNRFFSQYLSTVATKSAPGVIKETISSKPLNGFNKETIINISIPDGRFKPKAQPKQGKKV
jgi:hypothetical protein